MNSVQLIENEVVSVSDSPSPILKMKGTSKTFSGVTVLKILILNSIRGKFMH